MPANTPICTRYDGVRHDVTAAPIPPITKQANTKVGVAISIIRNMNAAASQIQNSVGMRLSFH